jgi:hypothetical protein
MHRGEPLTRYSGLAMLRGGPGVTITVLDLCFYLPIMMLSVVFCFNYSSLAVKGYSLLAILGFSLIYASPYWLTCSQPRYNFPVVPLFGVLAAALLDAWVERPWKDILAPVVHSGRRRRAMLFTLVFFIYIQIECAYIALFLRVS